MNGERKLLERNIVEGPKKSLLRTNCLCLLFNLQRNKTQDGLICQIMVAMGVDFLTSKNKSDIFHTNNVVINVYREHRVLVLTSCFLKLHLDLGIRNEK